MIKNKSLNNNEDSQEVKAVWLETNDGFRQIWSHWIKA